jgi:hypothetical protein
MPARQPAGTAPPERAMLWTRLPAAAALLASCASDPPRSKVAPYEGLTRYHKRLFVGRRVRRLARIHRAEAERILALCDAAGDHAAFSAHCALDVQTAIADAVIAGSLASSRAHDAAALAAVAEMADAGA